MSVSEKNTATKSTPTAADVAAPRPDRLVSITSPASVKDPGRVHVGAGMMRF
jgi:hypothetical protein